MLVRDDLREFFLAEILRDPDVAGAPSGFAGRTQIRVIDLPNGRRALIRSYRHGGFLRAVTGPVFFSRPARPFRELKVTEEARRRGIRTAIPCGACVEPLYGAFYKGWFVTEEIEGAVDLWAAASDRNYDLRDADAMWRSVGESIRGLHRNGILHNDLNLKNILVRPETGKVTSYIIDFDQARLFAGPVPQHDADKNLARLLRSIRKLDPARNRIGETHWTSLSDAYYGTRC
jgi:tRNA A-37 threonylcarbamoyl transferase component Bud32